MSSSKLNAQILKKLDLCLFYRFLKYSFLGCPPLLVFQTRSGRGLHGFRHYVTLLRRPLRSLTQNTTKF